MTSKTIFTVPLRSGLESGTKKTIKVRDNPTFAKAIQIQSKSHESEIKVKLSW